MWRKGNSFVLLMGIQTGAATVETSMQIPQKLKMDLPFDLATPPQGIYGKELRTLIQKNVSTPVHCSIIYNCQDLEMS